MQSLPDQQQLDRAFLRDSLIERTGFRDVRIQPNRLRNVPLADGGEFIAQAQRRYSTALSKRLTDVRADMQYRKRQLTSKDSELDVSLIAELERYLGSLLAQGEAGEQQALRFLGNLRGSMRKDRDALDQSRRAWRISAEADSISDQRTELASYGAAASGFLPFSSLALLLLIMLVPIIFLSVAIANSSAASGMFVAVLIVGILASMGIVAHSVLSVRAARTKLLESYNARLNAFREADLEDALVQMYDELIAWTDVR